MTKDNVSLYLTSVLYYRITSPHKAAFGISNIRQALVERTQTTLRHVIGARVLQDVIERREDRWYVGIGGFLRIGPRACEFDILQFLPGGVEWEFPIILKAMFNGSCAPLRRRPEGNRADRGRIPVCAFRDG